MRVELLRAWPRRFERKELDLPAGSCLADGLTAAGWADDPDTVAYAVFGVRVDRQTVLQEGDRVELLRPLQADPKEARRRRAGAKRPGGGGTERRGGGED
jgi:putative ubiquitin-RnfH superfamily antitoxin RatB of RatAB toxin-antitoxin module